MKRLSLIPLIVILTACVSSPAPVPPTQKIETATVVSATKTPIPTNTIEPTLTKDPNAPEGYTKDANGNYTLELNGSTYVWDEKMGMGARIDAESGKTLFWDAERKEEVSLMFDGMLWDQSPELEAYTTIDGSKHLTDQLELKVFIDPTLENWEKITVTHAENLDSPTESNFTRMFQTELWVTMTNIGMIKDPTDFSYDKWYTTHEYTRIYNTQEGEQRLILTDGNITTLHIVNKFKELFDDMENNGYTLVEGGNLGGPAFRYMIKIHSDENGNTYADIAPSIEDALLIPDIRYIEIFLTPLAGPLEAFNVDPYIPVAPSMAVFLAKNHASRPYFIIERAK